MNIEEREMAYQIGKQYSQEIKCVLSDYRSSKIELKQSPKKDKDEKVIDMFIDGDSIDNIKENLSMEYAEIENILNYSGLL